MVFLKRYPLLVFLGFVLGIKIIILLGTRPEPWFDEMAISIISRQTPPDLIRTVLSERFHPPGFYFFMKILPVYSNFLLSKVIISIISHVIILGGLIFGYKSGIIKKYSLQTGIMFFFSTFLFSLITSDLKQDSLSFPLLFVTFLLLFKMFDTKKLKSIHYLSLLFLLITLFFIAYISYAFAFVGLLILLYKRRNDKKLWIVILSQFVILFSYAPYGVKQYFVSKNRELWSKYRFNSFITAFSQGFSGANPQNYLTDLLTFTPIAFFLLGITRLRNNIKTYLGLNTVVILFLVPVFYFQMSLSEARYVTFFFFILCIVVGWGIDILASKTKIKVLTITIIISFFSLSQILYMNRIKEYKDSQLQTISLLKTKDRDTSPVGYITDASIYQFVMSLWYLKGLNIVPVNVFSPNLFLNKQTLSLETQQVLNQKREVSIDKISKLLKENNINRYVFIYIQNEMFSPLDRNIQILESLTKSCVLKDATEISSDQIFLYFEGCNF